MFISDEEKSPVYKPSCGIAGHSTMMTMVTSVHGLFRSHKQNRADFSWNYLKLRLCKTMERLTESHRLEKVHHSLACFDGALVSSMAVIHFPPCILQRSESILSLEVPHLAAQQEKTVAEYRLRLQKRPVLASSHHMSSFTLLRVAGWVCDKHLTHTKGLSEIWAWTPTGMTKVAFKYLL